jgi:hypothetical protein
MEWASTQHNLGITLVNQGRLSTGAEQTRLFGEAAKCYDAVLRFQPNQSVVNSCVALYADELGEYEKAHHVLQDWLKDHPEDLDNQMNFLESQFLTERFAECLMQSDFLRKELADSDQARHEAVRRVLEVMSLEVLEKLDDSQQRVQELATFLDRQPPGFKFDWSWKGMNRFVENSQHQQVQRHRDRLKSILDAVSQPDQPSIVVKLKTLMQ